MKQRFLLLTTCLLACARSLPTPRQLIDAPFHRQDSSIVNRAIDAVVHYATPFSSLIEIGEPTEIAISLGDSALAFQSILVLLTLDSLQAPDICRPIHRALIAAWRPLPGGASVQGLTVSLGSTSGSRMEQELVANPQCPQGGLHHPRVELFRAVDRKLVAGWSAEGGSVEFQLDRTLQHRACSWKWIVTWSKVNHARCEVASAGLRVDASRSSPSTLSGPLRISTRVRGVHLWIDCTIPGIARWLCAPGPPSQVLDSVRLPVAPPPPPPSPPRPVPVMGRVIDSINGAPLRGILVLLGMPGGVYSDSSGRFVIERMPGRVRPVASCPLGPGGQRVFRQDSITVRERMAEVLILIPPGVCAAPMPVQADSVFQGDYVGGFEQSEFRLCGQSWRKVWASFTATADSDLMSLSPKLRSNPRPRTMLWTVRAGLEGPGHYGHLGVSEYQLTIRKVIQVRPKRSGECLR